MRLWQNVNRVAGFLYLIFILGACSNATPEVSLLHSVDALDFTVPNVVTSDLGTVTLQGKCTSAYTTGVDMSFDGGTTWVTPNSYDSTASNTCVNGQFSITLSNQKPPWSTMSITNGQILDVEFRAHTRGGDVTQTVTVKYLPTATISQETMPGASTQTGGGMVLKSRVRAQQQHIATGGSLILRGRILQ
jgi:hypothetical protein